MVIVIIKILVMMMNIAIKKILFSDFYIYLKIDYQNCQRDTFLLFKYMSHLS
jgi:hypothetical protein